ncbi:MBL fold metallo-hydrolase [Paenibacillus rhizovicinus]|uniref:MBL fold metallo-hydrolase n=1 Tax=Paenibacillus rhizovicinus TaxID=2704463 RepID=A0A6C0PAE2_9BACL|nr:MBL fold metallo-hydrolase [Paenibacillus rhizovicinus]QHW34613.1 MBL fold metallo-hydrolase [Paenibacillus rhizovicinus]
MSYEYAAIQYIGQVGVIIGRNGFKLAVDPFLTDDTLSTDSFWKRSYSPPVEARELNDLNLVLVTHEHSDHLDPATLLSIAEASPSCRFAGPAVCAAILKKIGIPEERVDSLQYGEPYACAGGLTIHPIPAWHETRISDAEGRDRFLGYMMEWDGIVIYHAGDTLVTEELIGILKNYRIDVGMLPINGRDLFRHRRGIDGNMNAREAAALAVDTGMGVVVPLHFDLYPNNSEGIVGFVGELFDRHRGQRYHVFQPGETWVYVK